MDPSSAHCYYGRIEKLTQKVPRELDLLKIQFLAPQFELLLNTLLTDREKIRTRAWQAIGLAGAVMAFFMKLIFDHLGTWPLWAYVFLSSHVLILAWLATLLVKETFLPKAYPCPGQHPRNALAKSFLSQPLDRIMAGHAIAIGRRIDQCRAMMEIEGGALHRFVNSAVRSPLYPAILALLAFAIEHLVA